MEYGRDNQGTATRPTGCVWLRHVPSGDTRWHAVKELSRGHSVVTYCRGRWPESDDVIAGSGERCRACLVELALAELKDAPANSTAVDYAEAFAAVRGKL